MMRELPACLGVLRRRLENDRQGEGVREYIRVLRLLKKHSMATLSRAVEKALEHGAITRDAVAQFLYPQERSSYPEYLLRLTERELIDREQRAAERRLKAAKFPVLKTLESFDFSAQPSINEGLVRELMRGEYLSARENILLIGNPGTGKTHLAGALGHTACLQGERTRYYNVTGLVTQLLEQREERNLHRSLERNRPLILDELGYGPSARQEPSCCSMSSAGPTNGPV